MMAQDQSRTRNAQPRQALFAALVCSLFGISQASSTGRRSVVAFAANQPEQPTLKRERDSSVRLFSRGPDTQLSAATLGWSLDSASTMTAYEEQQQDLFSGSFWGPPPGVTTASVVDERQALETVPMIDTTADLRIYCDLDGVLCDFAAGVRSICKAAPEAMAKETMWNEIQNSGAAFFADLPWTHDGEQLWNAIKDYKPTILTGVPNLKDSCADKFRWCSEHLGMTSYRHVNMASQDFRHTNVNGVRQTCALTSGETNIITCWSHNKHHESGVNAVLIDDRLCLKKDWEAAGGVFVHHTDTLSTLQKLAKLGLFDDDRTTAQKRPAHRCNQLMP